MIRDLRSTVLRAASTGGGGGEPPAAGGRWIQPRYDGWSFSNVPGTILEHFGVEPPRPALDSSVANRPRPGSGDHLLLVLIDGLGFDTWVEDAIRFPFFSRVAGRGNVTSITSVFPSTTSASLTTLATGLPPAEHGLPEWMVYLEELDDVIASLPFKRWSQKSRDELLQHGIDPSILFEGKTIFQRLEDAGTSTVALSHHSYAQSAYSKVSKKGARSVGFLGLADLVVKLARELRDAVQPTFFYVYWDNFDTLEHAFSPRTPETVAELGLLSCAFTDLLGLALGEEGRAVAERTRLLVTADHGQIPVTPERTIYLTDRPEVRGALKTRRNGELIPPTGSIRDVFLHVKPSALEGLEVFLGEALAGRAEVLRTREAIGRGWFGPGEPCKRFRARIGDLMVLPHEGESVWGYYPGQQRPHGLRGHHGGLTPREVFIPLAEARLGEIIA